MAGIYLGSTDLSSATFYLGSNAVSALYDGSNKLYPLDIVQTNLVRYYDAGSTDSYSGTGTNWVDKMGSGYNLTLTNGPTWTSNGAGSYFTFDGTNDYAVGDDTGLPAGTSARTIGVWVYPLTSADFKGIFYYGSSALNDQVAWLQNAGYSPYSPGHMINVYGPWAGTLNGDNPLTTNAWNLIQFKFAGGAGAQAYSYFTNGTKYQTGTTSEFGTVLGGSTRFRIASEIGSLYYNCRIGSVFIYDAELSDTDILTNYNNTKARYGL